MNLIDEINTLEYLYLIEISEREDNVLRLVIAEARLQADETPAAQIKALGPLASGANPVVVSELSASYEVTFANYIAYAVVNESFTVPDKAEHFEGKLFRVYSESKFLGYIAAATIASEDYGGPYTHYGITCLNHIVAIASPEPPAIVCLCPPAWRR